MFYRKKKYLESGLIFGGLHLFAAVAPDAGESLGLFTAA